MLKKYKFPDCGCEFDVNEHGGLIIREHVYNPNCKKTYEKIAKGETIGCFQIESNLLRHWCKLIKPISLSEMGDLVAIIRPGTLRSIVGEVVNGKLESVKPDDPNEDEDEKKKRKKITAAELYVMVKNGDLPLTFFDPSLEPVLKKTKGIMLYQEQILKIAVLVAAFDLCQADLLRRGIGKKKADIVAECRNLFIDKAEAAGIMNKEKATELFTMIEAANRYSFNIAHSICYGATAYESIYQKQHFPLEFFCASLELSTEEQDVFEELRKLVSDARKHDIAIKTPNINALQDNFYIENDYIVFGLSNIKGICSTTAEKIKNVVKSVEKNIGKPISKWSWYDFLVNLTMTKEEKNSVGMSVLQSLIKVGALQVDEERQKMIYDLQNWELLSKGEQQWVFDNHVKFKTFEKALEGLAKPKKDGGGCSRANRLPILKSIHKILINPPKTLQDTISIISKWEAELLGVSLSCSQVESCDLSTVNFTCKEFTSGKSFTNMRLGVTILSSREHEIKNGASKGRKMAFLTVEDSSGELEDVVCFADEYEKFNHMLLAGNNCILVGNRDKNKGSFVVKDVFQI